MHFFICIGLAYSETGDETLTGLAIEASRKALDMAQVEPDELDLILMCTSTPDDLFGSGPQVIYVGLHT